MTVTTLAIELTADRISASGRLLPPQPGDQMVITLFREVGDTFQKVDTNRPSLSAASTYSTRFDRPNADRCRVKARYLGDEDLLPSSSTETFPC
jgi:hypothetical protein